MAASLFAERDACPPPHIQKGKDMLAIKGRSARQVRDDIGCPVASRFGIPRVGEKLESSVVRPMRRCSSQSGRTRRSNCISTTPAQELPKQGRSQNTKQGTYFVLAGDKRGDKRERRRKEGKKRRRRDKTLGPRGDCVPQIRKYLPLPKCFPGSDAPRERILMELRHVGAEPAAAGDCSCDSLRAQFRAVLLVCHAGVWFAWSPPARHALLACRFRRA